jgi:hypothetical protein
LPAIVRQVDLKTDSDIEAWRRTLRNFSREYVRRELWRFHTDLAALPRQFAQLATGNWRFATV